MSLGWRVRQGVLVFCFMGPPGWWRPSLEEFGLSLGSLGAWKHGKVGLHPHVHCRIAMQLWGRDSVSMKPRGKAVHNQGLMPEIHQ